MKDEKEKEKRMSAKKIVDRLLLAHGIRASSLVLFFDGTIAEDRKFLLASNKNENKEESKKEATDLWRPSW